MLEESRYIQGRCIQDGRFIGENTLDTTHLHVFLIFVSLSSR